VSETNSQQIKILDSRSLPVRIGIGVGIVALLAFGWLAVRWQVGNMLAELTSPFAAGARNVAQTALSLAPHDPSAAWLFVNTKNSDANRKPEIDTGDVVKLSPSDFRWWIELGREREQAGDASSAEKALQKAVELAPNYTFPHWQLGNFYLRQNRGDEAFRELAKVAETNTLYGEQVYSIAWEYFDRDTARLEQIAGTTPEARANLAKFFAGKGQAEECLRIWNTLTDEEKEATAVGKRDIAQALFDKGFYRSAVEFIRQLGIEPEAKAEIVQNAGFEKPIGEAKDAYFGWKIAPVEKMDVKLDPTQKHGGNRSLRVNFNGYSAPTLNGIYQIIAVEAKMRYRLSFWLRTENLKSAGAPNLEIYNAVDNKNVAVSSSFPVGTNDWQQIKVEFTAPENTEGVAIRTTRVYCGENCPIIGAFWYDDFRLERLK